MKRTAMLLCLALTACRDVPDRFAGPDPFDSIPEPDAGRLTWNAYEDHSPAWNATSDSVYYSARSYPGFPLSGGLLLSVPRTTGRAALLLESLQHAVSPQPWLTAPALSPDGESLAFVQLTEVNDPTVLCNAGIICGVAPPPAPRPDTGAANTMLVRGVLRVRALNGTTDAASIEIEFEGLQDSFRIAHPFQRQFERDRAEIFRPSWSPDGTQLVFSDGLRLLLWTVGQTSAVEIPNTDDGVWPAWSPNGAVIAFTRLQRNTVREFSCGCFRQNRPLPVASVYRIVYDDGGRRVGTLSTIRPDGTDLRELGIGEAPAWTPDGQFLVFQRNNELWRATADGSNATLLPNTEYAYEPAISRNGQWLTFSRDQASGDRPSVYIKPYDLWVVGF
ncbi:MAG TPA: hypothetical protein VGD27_07320 [Longimicrobiales bacterium]